MGIVKKADCLIFSAGARVDEDVVRQYVSDSVYMIAADGGYAFCRAVGCTPNFIVGDFDSGECPQTEIETLRLSPFKDDTDSAIAVYKAIERGYKHIVLFGGTGSRLDHTFADFYLCATAKQMGADLMLVDNRHQIFSLCEETAELSRDDGKYVSIFPLGGKCTLTLTGFCYPLEDYACSPFWSMGVSNEIAEDWAKITVEQGTALVFMTQKD